MTGEESSGRSAARAHLSQLIEMFGRDGCLRISTLTGNPVEGEPEDTEED